ncbi:MAG: glyoxalase superfamily protein [Gemmataceae bacterium]
MVRYLAIMPVLKVADLERSVQWYTAVLGFERAGRMHIDGADQCFLQAGGLEVLLSNDAHLGGLPSFTGTLYFQMEGVDALYARVAGRPEIVWPLETQEYGTREFGIRDPDGYTLAFAQRMADE